MSLEEGDDLIVMDFKTDRERGVEGPVRASAEVLPRVLLRCEAGARGCPGRIDRSPLLRGSDSLLEETPRWRFRMHTRYARIEALEGRGRVGRRRDEGSDRRR
jgi:hypothetical protein